MSTQAEPTDDGQLLVTFRLPHAVDVEQVCVVGEFNDWSHTAHPMERDGDTFFTQIPLPTGKRYRFRYLLDGGRWENDWAADAYVPNEFGGEDSVLDLTGDAARAVVVAEPPAAAEPQAATSRRKTQSATKERGTTGKAASV